MTLRSAPLRVRKIQTGVLTAKRLEILGAAPQGSILKRLGRHLERYVRHEVRHVAHNFEERCAKALKHQRHEIEEIEHRLRRIEAQLASGITPNPALGRFLESKLGQTVTISTPGGSVSGTVVLVGSDAVEIRENTGDIVIIPFSKITAVA